ncbi:MAG TPA: hypothetical protein VI216_04550 [Candidatus Acidoferrales bacterium]
MVLGFLHTSGYILIRYWLRSCGIPAAIFVRVRAPLYTHAQAIRDAGDKLYGLEQVPHMFADRKSMRDVIRFLTPGHVVVMALDESTKPSSGSYQINGQRIYLRDGAARLASASQAILVPVWVRQKGFCRFEINFGSPVSDDLVRTADVRLATQSLGQELWAAAQQDPEAIHWTVLETLFPEKIAPRQRWP